MGREAISGESTYEGKQAFIGAADGKVEWRNVKYRIQTKKA